MAVEVTDLEKRYSVKTGSAGDSVAGNAAGSLGKYISTTVVTDNTKGNLLPGITASQNESGIILYRCYFVVNLAADAWQGVKVWLPTQIAGGGQVSIGLDPTGVTAKGASPAQAVEIADEFTAPAGVTFTAPPTIDDALVVGDVDANECFAIWLKVVVPANTPAMNADSVTIHRWGTSAP